MEQARSTIFKMINGEPHSYTRFNLTQNMEGDNSHVEMKLSSDPDEESGENGVGVNHPAVRQPSIGQKLKRVPRNLCFLAAGTLLIFIIGYLIGYLVHRKKEMIPTTPDYKDVEEFSFPQEEFSFPQQTAPVSMSWKDIKKLLADQIDAEKLAATFREFSSTSHRAGTPGDDLLRLKVVDKFTKLGLRMWSDKHYMKVQEAPASGANKFSFKGGAEQRPEGFLAYSGNGTVTSTVVYAHFGYEEDFATLQTLNINVSGKVVLIRAGINSFAEKVANAAKAKAAAVLIYADPNYYSIGENTPLFGHVHLGSGDPYTPGFPSFNCTQFPPVKSSGLPTIPAQTITTAMANNILSQLGGPNAPAHWEYFKQLGDESDTITLEVNNVLVEKKINNIFAVIEGLVDPDRYVVIGAQRDAWGPGFAASTVGTSVLMELARSMTAMVKTGGFKPRRSIIFASWSGGAYGSVGATEWLEAHLSTLSQKVFAFINLDGIVSGYGRFKVAGSPLMHVMIYRALREIESPTGSGTLFTEYGKDNWEANVLTSLKMDNEAYPFLGFSGIPSVTFGFTQLGTEYPFFGTPLDTEEKLRDATDGRLPELAALAARFAGHMALRLVHDHLLQMDLLKYDTIVMDQVRQIDAKIRSVKRTKPSVLSESLTVDWLVSASGSYSRALQLLANDFEHMDLENVEKCRILNDRIMSVERNFLSPYVSPKDVPFRHILLGRGPHTLAAVSDHLDHIRTDNPKADASLFLYQFGLSTWTIQGCANALAGRIWALDKDI